MQGFMHTPAASMLQGIYAKHMGVALGALGTAVLLTRLFDAITDPVIGIWSDAIYRRKGSRKSLVVGGSFITVLGLWFLYRPQEDAGIFYFTGWFLVTYLGWTITEIPYRAWSMELTSEYAARTRIQTWLAVGALIGIIGFYLVPYITQALGLTATAELDIHMLAYAAIPIVLIMPILNIIAAWKVPDGEFHVEPTKVKRSEILKAVAQNGPLMYLILLNLAVGIVNGFRDGASYLYIDTYLGLSKEHAGMLIVAVPVTLIAIPFWGWMCQRYERQKVWALTLVATGIANLAYGFVPPDGQSAAMALSCMIVAMFFAACSAPASAPMFGDVIDYGRWKFNHDFGGLYMSFFSLISKTIAGIGVAVGFILLGWFGFEAAATQQTESGALGIRLIVAWIPGLAMIVTAPFVWRFPLNRARHEDIMRQIEARDAELAAQKP